MNCKNTKSLILSNLNQVPGWRTDRKLVIFESDDWGSVRMPSREVYLKLIKKGLRVNSFYNRFDSLASAKDLDALFNVLLSFKDFNGNRPAIMANCLVANPDFQEIRKREFQEYHYEPFTETLKNTKGCESSFSYWKEGFRLGIFNPQYHGREHLNVDLWMNALKEHHLSTHTAFNFGFWGQQTDYPAKRKHFLAAFDYDSKAQLDSLKCIAKEGISLFRSTIGIQPVSFVAPNYVWDSEIEQTLKDEHISLIQSQRRQLSPISDRKKYEKTAHFTGQKNRYGQIFIVRNGSFEPSLFPNADVVDSCLSDIRRSFFWKKPAVISVHRVNFIGTIDSSNRDRNLKQFVQLLQKILLNWPDVEFITTDELLRVIDKRDLIGT